MEIEHKKISCIVILCLVKNIGFFRLIIAKKKKRFLILRALFH
ncbi:hypothetical protein HMPREF1396_01527 [Helicobacter pylori GAM114Ai]|nr:hypothetical protein HPHPP25D_1715 [Helicobacter pylori Hp P-25d]EJC35519.1 hypothetical protein HPHPP25C_0007 [Helicobacter pylori Hp P-25c]EMG82188.1 hypothetical protein HMPREF1394_01022 [Helicobacter pylori GAM105Ai]EMG85429.1 hypothetical protein HMPREF1396_01527 [Helicobacter pylori GAM114Ai]